MEITAPTALAQLAQTLQTPAEPPAAPQAIAAPDGLAAARFQSLMQTPPAEMTAPAAAAQEAAGAVAAHSTTSLGDRMLAGMQSATSDIQGGWRSVASTLNSTAPMDTREMLQIQLQLSQIAVQYELLGKAVARSTQNIDQLVRIQ